MWLYKYIIVVIGTLFCLANGHKLKSSLAFVIDVTSTMSDEIEQVKSTTDNIFDNVFNSTTNNIDDFILITFADPSANVAVKTRNRNEFKQALQDITLQNGGTCPEASMTGIKLALKNSHPNSFLYVFTDASAIDYKYAPIVKSLSQKLSTQVNFLLTGKCKFGKKKMYLVYDEIAETTSGHIFNIKKDDVAQMIDFIAHNLKSKTTVLKRKLVEDNFDQVIPFTIDSKNSNVFICVSSSHPRFSVYNSKQEQINVLNVVKTENNTIVRLEKELNGNYFIKLDQQTRTLVTVTSSTSICFQHGFSTTQPTSLSETSIKPSGNLTEPHYLLIQLDNDANDVLIENSELVDINDNIILTTLPLMLFDEDEQIYVTEPFEVPKGMFRIAIVGYTESNEKIRRVTIPTIQRPDPRIEKLEEPSKKAPEINILAEPKIYVDFNKSISLTCKVHAVPEPDITWIDNYGKEVQPKIIHYDFPYYGSILTIGKVDKEGELTCKATNSVGKDERSVVLEIKRNTSTSIVNSSTVPPHLTYVYEAIVGDLVLQIPCNIASEGSSLANIKWEYRSGEKVKLLSRTETDVYIIDFNATLILNNINKNSEGFYKCSVESLDGINWTESEVLVKENLIPLASKLRPKSTLLLGTSLHLPCDEQQDKTRYKRYARWYKDGYFIKNCSRDDLCDFDLVNVTLDDTGVYSCRISTIERSISVHKQVIVVFPPVFTNEVETIIAFKENILAFLDCNSYGYPTPEIVWSMGSKIISKNSTISFNMEIEKIGIYKCIVSNERGSIHRLFEIKSNKECQLNVTFHRNMPLLLSTSSAWIVGSVQINKNIKIICLNSIISDNKRSYSTRLEAKCLENTSFKTKEFGIIDISELKCDKDVHLTENKLSEKNCVKEPSELMGIGFKLETEWIGIFDVCIDKNTNVTYFIKYSMNIQMSNKIPKDYAETQLQSFKSEVDVGCRTNGAAKCCFAKKQLLSPEDVLPGLQQIAAYSYRNFVTQWSSCGTENWDEVGQRLRSLSTSLNQYLEVWMGISELKKINDKYNRVHNVPRYIWKIIFNKNGLRGLAIIVENIPQASDYSCTDHPPCTDVCNQTSWMKNSQWQNSSKGCVFCCSLTEFMKMFHYENIFPPTINLLI